MHRKRGEGDGTPVWREGYRRVSCGLAHDANGFSCAIEPAELRLSQSFACLINERPVGSDGEKGAPDDRIELDVLFGKGDRVASDLELRRIESLRHQDALATPGRYW